MTFSASLRMGTMTVTEFNTASPLRGRRMVKKLKVAIKKVSSVREKISTDIRVVSSCLIFTAKPAREEIRRQERTHG